MRGIAAACFLLLPAPALAQLSLYQTLTLQPPIPLGYWSPNAPISERLESVRMVTGDLDDNGVADLVFSNQLGFLRVYFLQRGASGQLEQMMYPPPVSTPVFAELVPFDTSVTCTSAPQRKSMAIDGLDIPMVYDIDLDGVNELIYHRHPGGPDDIVPCIYDWNAAGTSATNQMLAKTLTFAGGANSIGNLVHTSYLTPCGIATGGGHNGGTISIHIANFRGRAYPQDIVYSSDGRGLKNVAVFFFDNAAGGAGTMDRKLYEKDGYTPLAAVPINQSEPGHLLDTYDVDYDGRDDLFGGKNLYRFVPGTGQWDLLVPLMPPVASAAPTVFKTSAGAAGATNVHPDQAVAADLWRTYRDPAGNIIPSPGVELAVAPQTVAAGSSPGDSGPWVYRAVAGHHLADDSGAGWGRRWPRKLLDFDATILPDKYWWLTTNPLSYVQPAPTSDWASLGAFLQPGGGIPDPDPQGVVVANLVSGFAGPELLVLSKSLPGGTGCAGGTLGHVHYLFSSTTDLRALSFGNSSHGGSNGPTIWGTRVVDVVGFRDTQEVTSVNAVSCAGMDPVMNLYSWDATGVRQNPWSQEHDHPTTGWEWDAPVNVSEAFFAGDLLGDAREEIYYLRHQLNPTPTLGTTRVDVWGDPTDILRPEPTPNRFLDYRTRCQESARALRFESFHGLKLVQSTLPIGTANSPYGILQDSAMGGAVGVVLAAEGGVPPYTIQLDTVNGDRLHRNLTTQVLTGQPNSLANSTGAGALRIHGTPAEHGTRRLRVTIQDSASPPRTATEDVWLRILPGGGSTAHKPVIVSGGFDGAFLTSSGSGQFVTFEAKVADGDNDTVQVDVFFEGFFLMSLPPATGGWFRGTMPVPTGFPVGDYRVTMVAIDSLGNRSLQWPYLVVDGGPGEANPAFVAPGGTTSGSTTTIAIDHVTFTPNDIPAAEGVEMPWTVNIAVLLGPVAPTLTVTGFEVKVVHPLTSGNHFQPVTLTFNPVTRAFEGAFQVPRGQFGWGHYTLNVRALATNGTTSFQSDWWPRLVIH
jgi:hypothetical protein